MDSWKAPSAKAYEVVYKNMLGVTTVRFTYLIHYTYGGRFKGNGQYLTNVTVQSSKVQVWWLNRLAAKVEIPNVTNAGTVDDPIAAMTLLVNWEISNIFSYYQDSVNYEVKGDGSFQALSFASPQ
jgi:hypothetical protein